MYIGPAVLSFDPRRGPSRMQGDVVVLLVSAEWCIG